MLNYQKKFKSLSDSNRLYILHILATNGKTCVCDLSELLKLSQSKLSYHLKILLDANFITVEKEGKWNYYSANSNELKKVLSNELCCLFYSGE
ncbi:winged helix-turn-helix transcriptional regulator [Cerasibacillus terrae]|uniref:Winged helix-turn-helix transcriptional regulator n=1 Tax=Cerasibacillus terrae TaxID=2498845 RepID=A0A5C8NVE9_9BACI|nr:winged helix-turn-helix transcriptional regulator [Cerasibacillus terrae]